MRDVLTEEPQDELCVLWKCVYVFRFGS